MGKAFTRPRPRRQRFLGEKPREPHLGCSNCEQRWEQRVSMRGGRIRAGGGGGQEPSITCLPVGHFRARKNVRERRPIYVCEATQCRTKVGTCHALCAEASFHSPHDTVPYQWSSLSTRPPSACNALVQLTVVHVGRRGIELLPVPVPVRRCCTCMVIQWSSEHRQCRSARSQMLGT